MNKPGQTMSFQMESPGGKGNLTHSTRPYLNQPGSLTRLEGTNTYSLNLVIQISGLDQQLHLYRDNSSAHTVENTRRLTRRSLSNKQVLRPSSKPKFAPVNKQFMQPKQVRVKQDQLGQSTISSNECSRTSRLSLVNGNSYRQTTCVPENPLLKMSLKKDQSQMNAYMSKISSVLEQCREVIFKSSSTGPLKPCKTIQSQELSHPDHNDRKQLQLYLAKKR